MVHINRTAESSLEVLDAWRQVPATHSKKRASILSFFLSLFLATIYVAFTFKIAQLQSNVLRALCISDEEIANDFETQRETNEQRNV